MSQQELISKIMHDVTDEQLRDDLLRQIASGGNGGGQSQSSRGQQESIVMSELDRMGFNGAAVRDYVKFQGKSGVVAGYIIGVVFTIGGALGVVAAISGKSAAFCWFPAIFCAGGIYSIINATKMKRAVGSAGICNSGAYNTNCYESAGLPKDFEGS